MKWIEIESRTLVGCMVKPKQRRYNSLAAAVPAVAEAAVVLLEFHLTDRGQKVGELTKYYKDTIHHTFSSG